MCSNTIWQTVSCSLRDPLINIERIYVECKALTTVASGVSGLSSSVGVTSAGSAGRRFRFCVLVRLRTWYNFQKSQQNRDDTLRKNRDKSYLVEIFKLILKDS